MPSIPTLAGTSTARDFVEFPSQFNEHWATYPAIFAHYAKHYKTGAAYAGRTRRADQESRNFQQRLRHDRTPGCRRTRHAVALPFSDAPLQNPDEFEKQALREDAPQRELRAAPLSLHLLQPHLAERLQRRLLRLSLDRRCLPTTPTSGSTNTAELTRANGDRFRKMVLSRGNTEDLAKMYENWRGAPPNTKAMLKHRGLEESGSRQIVATATTKSTDEDRRLPHCAGLRAIQCAACDLSARKLSRHCFAAESNSANSGVPRSFAHAESFCKPV